MRFLHAGRGHDTGVADRRCAEHGTRQGDEFAVRSHLPLHGLSRHPPRRAPACRRARRRDMTAPVTVETKGYIGKPIARTEDTPLLTDHGVYNTQVHPTAMPHVAFTHTPNPRP